MQRNSSINERSTVYTQSYFERIQPEDGRYRKVQVMIQGSSHMPLTFLVAKEMEDFFGI
jgi:hypothetical protein